MDRRDEWTGSGFHLDNVPSSDTPDDREGLVPERLGEWRWVRWTR